MAVELVPGSQRTGTAFHFSATFPKEQVRLDGERKIYERDADSGYCIGFHFCPNCGTTLIRRGPSGRHEQYRPRHYAGEERFGFVVGLLPS